MNISSVAKYVDQPVLLHKLQNMMPVLLMGGGTAFGVADTLAHSKGDKKERQQRAIKSAIIIPITVAASLIGTRGLRINGKTIVKGLMENTSLDDIKKIQIKAVGEYTQKTGLMDTDLIKILKKCKEGIQLSITDIGELTKKLPESGHKKKLFSKILPEPGVHSHGGHAEVCSHDHSSWKEIWRLSKLGLIPVVGGIFGGITADAVTGTGSKKATANKVKEGFYQYLANIALCNVGAGVALTVADKLEHAHIINPLSRTGKLGVILVGIISAGVVGGSVIANYLSKKIIDPLFNQDDKDKNQHIYSERKPEALDIALHIDDIATAGVLSGFKWIEPALPFMYFISGYRAGIGYRNGKEHHHHLSGKTMHKKISDRVEKIHQMKTAHKLTSKDTDIILSFANHGQMTYNR